jgi:hypothetical protein
MELVSGFLLWIADLSGVKWIRKERSSFKKVVKSVTFLIVGIILVMGCFAFWYS